jgi:hypothetical protein
MPVVQLIVQDVLTQTQKVHIFHRGDEVFEMFSDSIGTVLMEELERWSSRDCSVFMFRTGLFVPDSEFSVL